MKFIESGIIILVTMVIALEAQNISITPLESKLLDMVVECKTCKNNINPGKQRPAFTATKKTPETLPNQSVVKYEDVILNRGGGYDPSTGIFTAPMTGLYQISATVMSSGGTALNAWLKKNDQNLLFLYGSAIHGATETANPILELQTGDKVYVMGSGPIGGVNYCYFSGFYISE